MTDAPEFETTREPEIEAWTPWPEALAGWAVFAAFVALLVLLVRIY